MLNKSFENTKGKIRKTWNQTFQNEFDISNLSRKLLKFNATDSTAKELHYGSEWILGTSDNSYKGEFEIDIRLPEIFIPMIKIFPIIKTEEPFQEELDYLNLTFDTNYNIFRLDFNDDSNNQYKWYNYKITVDLSSNVIVSGNYIPIYYKLIVIILKERYFNEFRQPKR